MSKVVAFETKNIRVSVTKENELYVLAVQELGQSETLVFHKTLESAIENFHEHVENQGGIRA